MITEEDEYFLRASMLVLIGGRLVSKETLYKELRKAGGNLDVLLKQHERTFKHKFVKKQRKKLFPAAGVTDVETWDLAMLTTVSLTVFKKSLRDDEKNDLKSIRCMRDEIYAHTYSSSLSADQYNEIRKELQNALTSLSNGLSKKLKDDCFKIIQECTTGPISPSFQEEFTKQLEDTEPSFQNEVNKLRNQNEFLSEMKRDIMDKLNNLSLTEDRSEKIIKVIDNEVTLSGAVNESKGIDFVERIITTVINKAIKKVGNENDCQRIRSVVDNILLDIENMPDGEILPAEHKSILHPTYIDSDVAKGESNDSTYQYPNDGMSVACGGSPGDPSDSEGSDSEDDSKKDRAQDDRDENDPKIDGKKECNISDWRIDTEVWKKCIDKKNVQEANRLLNERILPGQDLLDRGSDVFGISSKIVQNICTAICCYMKESFLHINHVYPALDYRHELSNKQITFVIYRARPHENETTEYRYYRYYIRHVNEISTPCSEENTHIRELEQDFPKDYSKTEEIVECLNKNSKSLMEQHTNLTRVSISWFKSKGFGTKHQNITQKTCIVLYVQVKGFVPLNETALPEVIDGIDVDVRECVVLPYTFPNEHHEHIKMGCAIHGGLRNAEGRVLGGTLGGFFEVDREMYCLTSAHTFMSPADMGKLKECGKFCDLGLGNDIETFEAHQPVVEGSRSFGTGVRAVYKEGGNGETGVEAVVIKVQDRFPVSGEFPACPRRRNPGIDRPKFSTGKICNREEVNRLIRSKTLTVVKFGCSSGWTRGSFRFSAGAARLSNMVGSIHSFGILLHNQFEIENIGETQFAEFGDSGALVFTDENNELSVTGIVEGGTPGVKYVTPICDVFSALELQNVQSTKEFTLHYQGIQNIPMEITSDSYSSRTITDRSDSGISTNDEAVLQHIDEKFKTFDQEITQEVARQVHEIKENMNTTVNQELSPVKSELSTLKSEVTVLKADITNVKSEVERTKSELKQDIEKSNTEIQSKMNVMQEQFTAQTNSIKNMLSEFIRSNNAANASNTNTT
ncbi:uncharacterized protein LOC123560067 [Mercenaria mercenaria]|uniref:uncharacterized protein LOC123560067 n=1 Tax=Mercenaria mercenaria TaxID=6596 RepID=UPI00234E4308|nr:uncharacterized protein LOC123560067 [Mercenaria mercenaria]